jgi:hypothetical protein
MKHSSEFASLTIGKREQWNIGILENKKKFVSYDIHHSIIPEFQHSMEVA